MDPLARNHVSIVGNGSAARTMVFVHGFGTDQRVWTDVARPFLDDFRVVLLDNAGAGRSDPAAFVQHNYLRLDRYAADLVEVCDALGLRDAILIGHSVGAMLCLLAAVRRPDLVSRLVLIGASPRYLDEPGYHGGFSEALLAETYSTVSRSYTSWADGFAAIAMANPERPQLAQHFANSLKSIPAGHALTVLYSIFQSDHRADLPRVARPTLLIQARDDIAVPPEVAEYLHRHIAGSLLTVIDATGHLPHVSAPDQVIAAMQGFVRG
jgi:sigma-B regulation protein RsbQ